VAARAPQAPAFYPHLGQSWPMPMGWAQGPPNGRFFSPFGSSQRTCQDADLQGSPGGLPGLVPSTTRYSSTTRKEADARITLCPPRLRGPVLVPLPLLRGQEEPGSQPTKKNSSGDSSSVNPRKIIPGHSIDNYNVRVSSRPGSVYNTQVYF